VTETAPAGGWELEQTTAGAEGTRRLAAALAGVCRPGDVVLYERPSGNFRLAGNQHGYIRVAPGQWIERILAGPGDHVRWENGRLTVNGQAALFQPLNSAVSLPSFSWDIPQEHYLILSAIGGRQRIDLSETDWRFLIVVPRSSIHGRVFLRSYPFTRVQRIS